MTPRAEPERAAGRAERRLAAACAGGMLLASAGSWLRLAVERTARIDTGTTAFLVASAVAGAGLLLCGVCALRLAPRAAALGWPGLWRAALAVQGAALLGVPLTSTDAYTNVALGALWRRGLSPLAHPPAALGDSPLLAVVPPRWAAVTSAYGPLYHPFAGLAAWAGEAVGAPLWGGVAAGKLLVAGALVAALALAARHLRAHRRESASETFALLALTPLLPWEITAQGHNEGLVVLAFVAALAWDAAGRPARAAAALAAGAAVKYALAPVLALAAVRAAWTERGRRAALPALAGAAVLAAAFAPELGALRWSAFAAGLGGDARHAHSLGDLVVLVAAAGGRPELGAAAVRALGALSAVLAFCALAVTAVRARTPEASARGALLVFFAVYLTAPWFQPWYAAWALPLLLVEPDPAWRGFVALFAVVTVVQWAAPLDPVTTVAGDAWAAWRLARLLRSAPAAASKASLA